MVPQSCSKEKNIELPKQRNHVQPMFQAAENLALPAKLAAGASATLPREKAAHMRSNLVPAASAKLRNVEVCGPGS